jgi:hypothetical protein
VCYEAEWRESLDELKVVAQTPIIESTENLDDKIRRSTTPEQAGQVNVSQKDADHSAMVPTVITLANRIARELHTMERREGVCTAVSLYLACKLQKTPRTMKEMCALTNTNVKQAQSLYNRAIKVQRFAKMFLNSGADSQRLFNTSVTATLLENLESSKGTKLDDRSKMKILRRTEHLMLQLHRVHPGKPSDVVGAVAMFAILGRSRNIPVFAENFAVNGSFLVDIKDVAKAALVSEQAMLSMWNNTPDSIKMPCPLPRN